MATKSKSLLAYFAPVSKQEVEGFFARLVEYIKRDTFQCLNFNIMLLLVVKYVLFMNWFEYKELKDHMLSTLSIYFIEF